MDHGLLTVGCGLLLFTNGRPPLRPFKPRVVYEIAPGKLERLNTSQKKIMRRLLGKGEINVAEMAKALNITPQAVRKDMAKLQRLELIEQRGKARATYYVLKEE